MGDLSNLEVNLHDIVTLFALQNIKIFLLENTSILNTQEMQYWALNRLLVIFQLPQFFPDGCNRKEKKPLIMEERVVFFSLNVQDNNINMY